MDALRGVQEVQLHALVDEAIVAAHHHRPAVVGGGTGGDAGSIGSDAKTIVFTWDSDGFLTAQKKTLKNLCGYINL